MLRNQASAFINLKVFTGNTITNSYAESVNAQLHCFDTNVYLFQQHQLTLFQHFVASKPQTKLSTFDPQPLNGLFENEVLARVANLGLIPNGRKAETGQRVVQKCRRS